MTTCSVNGCALAAQEIVEIQPEGAPIMQTAACADHALELRAGAAFELRLEDRAILLGEDLPLSLVTYTVDEDISGLTFTLELGRGPEVRQKVTFRTKPNFRFGEPGEFYAGPDDSPKV